MSTEVVAKGHRPKPLRRAYRNEMQVMRAERWRRFAEPMFEFGLVRRVGVAHAGRRLDCRARLLKRVYACHDVDDGFRGKSGYRSTADVLDRPCQPGR